MHAGRYAERIEVAHQPVGAAHAGQCAGLDQRSHALFDVQRIALRALGEHPLQRQEARIAAEQVVQQMLGALRPQRIDTQLAVIGLAGPGVAILGPEVDRQQHRRTGHAVSDEVEEGLRLRVDPVQILEHQHHRLHLALAQ